MQRLLKPNYSYIMRITIDCRKTYKKVSTPYLSNHTVMGWLEPNPEGVQHNSDKTRLTDRSSYK